MFRGRVHIPSSGPAYQSLFDLDGDTGIWVEKTADDDTIRVDLGGATPIANALTINQASGFVWNADNNSLNFILNGSTDNNILRLNSDGDGIVFGGTDNTWMRAGATINSKFFAIKPDRPRWNSGVQVLYSTDPLRATDFSLMKAGGTEDTPTIVASNGIISNLRYEAFDGTDFHVGAVLRVQVDAAVASPANDDVRLQWRFLTWDGSTTAAALTIRANRNIGIGTTDPSYLLEVSGGDISTDQEVRTWDKIEVTKAIAMNR